MPGEQQAVSHPVPAREAADRLASLQGLPDMTNLLVATPLPPTFGAFRHVTSKLDLRSNPRPPLKLYKTAAVGRRRRDTDSETTQVNLSSPQIRQALWQSRLVCGLGRRGVDRIMQP